MKVAYCTGFWCTNIGNGFFSLGVEHVLRKVFGAENVTVVSDYQTYTNAIGKRLYPDKKQLEYIADLDVDMVVLAGPVLSRYFLQLWKDILLKLQARGVRYIADRQGESELYVGRSMLNNENQNAINSLILNLNRLAYRHFPITMRCKWLLPVFWFYLPMRYILRSLLGLRKQKSVFRALKQSNKRFELHKRLHLYEVK